jgi:hypothetical protein
MIQRTLHATIVDRLRHDTRAVIVYGARQVGKTTLINHVLDQLPYRTLRITADAALIPEALSSRDLSRLRGLTQGYDVLFLDEAQRVPDVGINIKLMVDHLPGLRIIATGSSTLDLASRTRESLAGRAWTYTLFPIAAQELAQTRNPFEMRQDLGARLVFGSYPAIVEMQGDAERTMYLDNLAAAALYKDILEIGSIRNSDKLRRLLRLLAFQIGQETSMTELGTQLDMSKNTVASYIDLLEQSFILFRLSGYSRNLRKEISKLDKVYFWDLGVRNILIGNMNALDARNDVGQLWENYVIAERLKRMRYAQQPGGLYYWRTRSGSEVDFVEESGGRLRAYECKWSSSARARTPTAFLEAYPESTFEVVTPENFFA